jgi:hypothetical protein
MSESLVPEWAQNSPSIGGGNRPKSQGTSLPMLNLGGKSVVYYSALDKCLFTRYQPAKG